MNREIKFRAWSKSSGKMIYRVIAGNTITDDPCSLVWDECVKEWVNFDRHCGHIMQFSCLIDKNGKEIYEGDIVKAKYEIFDDIGFQENIGIVVYNTDIAGFSVNTRDYMARIKGFRNDGYQSMDLFPLNNCIIIGNVFEHPELLETSK